MSIKKYKKMMEKAKDFQFSCVVQPFYPKKLNTWNDRLIWTKYKLLHLFSLGYIHMMQKPAFHKKQFLIQASEIYKKVASTRRDNTALYHITTKFGYFEAKSLKPVSNPEIK